MSERIEVQRRTARESTDMPPETLADWLLRQDAQAIELLNNNPDGLNDVTKTFVMLYAANKVSDPPRGPDQTVKGMLWGTKTVKGETLKTPAELSAAASGLSEALHAGLENERPGPIVDMKAVERNIAKVARIQTTDAPEGVETDPRTAQYLRLVTVALLGDRMKEAQFVNEYFASLKLQPLEILSIHTMLHRTIEAIDAGKIPMVETRNRLVMLCKKLEGSTNERVPWIKRYF